MGRASRVRHQHKMMAQRQAHQAKKAAHPQAGERSGVTLMPQPPRKAPTPVITEVMLCRDAIDR